MAMAAMAVEPEARVATCAAMAGAAFLDLDKPFEHFFGLRPFPKLVTRIHKGVQNESVDGMSNEFAYGALFTLADAITVVSARRRAGLHRSELTARTQATWRFLANLRRVGLAVPAGVSVPSRSETHSSHRRPKVRPVLRSFRSCRPTLATAPFHPQRWHVPYRRLPPP